MIPNLLLLLAARRVRAALQVGVALAVVAAAIAAFVAGSWALGVVSLCLGATSLFALKLGLVVLVEQHRAAYRTQRLERILSESTGRTVREVRALCESMRDQVVFDVRLRADLEKVLAQLAVAKQELAHRHDHD